MPFNPYTDASNTTPLAAHQDAISPTVFAMKLSSILKDPSTQAIVCWGPQRDRFIVKDTNEFSESVLPQIFNHSDFAVFVRDLIDHGFHETKEADLDRAGEQTFTFHHPDFHADRPDDVRKVQLILTPGYTSDLIPSPPAYPSPPDSEPTTGTSRATFMDHVTRLRKENEDLKARTRDLEEGMATMQSDLDRVGEVLSRRDTQIRAIEVSLAAMNLDVE